MEKAKIEFPHKAKPEFIKELRANVDNYFKTNGISKYGNMNLFLKTVFMFSLLLIPYILMLSGIVSSFWAVLACWIVMGIGTAGVGMGVMHDANHRTYSKSQRMNMLMGKSLYLLGGFPVNWQHQHNTLHHGFTNIEGHDEDIDPGPVLRLSPHQKRLKVHRYQHLYCWFLYGLMTISWVISKDYGQLKRYQRSGAKLSSKNSYNQLFAYLIISKILYFIAFLVVPILVLPFAWYWVIVFFLAMHFTCGFILTVVFQTAHVVTSSEYPLPDDNGTMENNWAVHQLLTTSDFSPKNRVLTWLIGGLNYQVEHHLFPNISHVHYRKLAGMVQEMAEKYGLPYHVQPGFIKAVGDHARMLRNLGRS